jgi:hypothetical protein
MIVSQKQTSMKIKVSNKNKEQLRKEINELIELCVKDKNPLLKDIDKIFNRFDLDDLSKKSNYNLVQN